MATSPPIGTEDLKAPNWDSEPFRRALSRTAQLAEVTAALVGTTTEAEVASVIVRRAAAALGATTSGLWLRTADQYIVLAESTGYSENTLKDFRAIPLDPPVAMALTDAARTGRVIWLADKAAYEVAYPQIANVHDQLPEYSFGCLPLIARGEILGVLAFSFEERKEFGSEDFAFLLTIANYSAQALDRARLFASHRHAREALESAQQQTALLLEANHILAESLDYEETLQKIARLAVPKLADWCLVELLRDDGGGTTPVALAHSDPMLTATALEFVKRSPPKLTAESGVGLVLRTGRAVLYDKLPAGDISQTRTPEFAELVRRVAPRSSMIVPMLARGRVIGAISFISAESGRVFGPNDLSTAELIGRRAGVDVDNARLYMESTKAAARREDLLAIVSHDLRNPLQAVMLRMAVLAQTAGDAATPENARLAAGSAQISLSAMTRIIDDLLEDASIQKGKLAVAKRAHTAVSVLNASRDAVGPVAEQKKIALNVELADSTPSIECDLGRILQVTGNLLSNALKYTPTGGSITLGARPVENAVEFYVRDTGPGIPEADLPRVFERFWRGKNTDHRGLGLGLSIARELVEAHGGQIRVANTHPGAVFSFTLPATT